MQNPRSLRPLRIVLADDHQIIREALALVLSDHPTIEIVGQAADGAEAVACARRLKPDIIVMDIAMPRMNGIEATRRLREELPSIAVIGLSLHNEDEMVEKMLSAGAVSYVSKSEPLDALVELICAVRETVPGTPATQSV
jgi:DNA-binding NarL/FixJ family response regulator